jgi:hypothetical protein
MVRSTIRNLIILCLSMVSANNVFADLPPVLMAKGIQQQCDSIKVWTRTAQELAGEDVLSGITKIDLFVTRIGPAFADSVFEPLIGKPFRNLSDNEKNKIFEIVNNCVVAGILPFVFHTSDQVTDSSHRQMIITLENVTEAEAEAARAAAALNAIKNPPPKKGKPELVARSLPGDPKAVKRQKLTKRMCYADHSGWRFLYNDYVFDGESVVASTNERLVTGDQPCSNVIAMQRFIPNVTSIMRNGNPRWPLLAVGDICGKDPEILFLYAGRPSFPKYHEFPRHASRQGQYSQHFGTVAYQFYVASGSDGVQHPGFINRVESGILVAREVVMKQCRKVPDSIRVVGGSLRNYFGTEKRDRKKKTYEKLDYWEFYSGTFYPNEPERRLVHGDPEMATTFTAVGKAYADYQRAGREEKENESDGSLVLGFVALMLAAKYMANPCDDSGIPFTARQKAGCFD